MDRGARMPEAEPAPADAALVEAARGAPAAFYQFRVSPSGTYSFPFISPDFVARYGVEQGEPEETAARFFSRIHPDDMDSLRAAISRSARSLESFEMNFRFRDSTDAEVWVEARSKPERTADGGVLWNGIATDITNRVQAEALLRESEARLRLFVRHAPAALAMFDRDMRYITASLRWLSDYGLGDRDVTGLSHYEVLPEIPERWKETHRRGLAGEVLSAEEDRFERADGSVQWIRWEIRPWRTNGGDVGGIVIFAEDITNRRIIEEELRESRERFRAMFDVAPVGVAQADPVTGRWLAVNPRMCLITGYTADELLALRVPEITHPEDRDRDWQLFQDVVNGEVPEYRLEKRYVRKDGSIAWVNVNMVVLRDAGGRPTRTVAMIEDITERRRVEESVVRLHAELRDSLEWQRQIFEGSRDAVFLSDAEGRFVAVNLAATELTGYSREELLSMTIPDLHDEADLAAYRAFHQRILGGEQILSEAPIRRKDGTKVAVEFNNSSVAIGGGHLVHTAGRDVTERKRSTHRLTLQAEMGRVLAEAGSLAEAMPRILQALGESEDMAFGAWWEPDPDTGNLRCAHTWSADPTRCAELDAATRSLSVRPGETIPGIVWTTRVLLHEPDLEGGGRSPRAPAAARAGLHAAVAFPLLRNGAPVGVVEFFAPQIPELDPALAASVQLLGGQIALYLERNRAQEETSHVLACSPAVLYALRVTGADLKISWFSDNIQALTGYSRAEVEIDEETWWASGIHPDDRARVFEANQTVLERDSANLEFRFRRKDGSWLWLRDAKRLLRDTAGRPAEIVGSWMDVTDRVRLEEQLRQAQKMEAIGQLAGGVAHDFNNLLTVISGNTELLLSDSRADDPRRGPLTDIRAAGERAANLTRQLLAFSRKQILEPKLVDVNEVVTGIEKMLRRLIGEDVDIATDLAADPSWVKVDPGQLEQVVMNLAVNARDAMPRGGRLTIRTRNVDADSIDFEESAGRRHRPRVAISIADTGTGITPEVKVHLFEPFFTTKGVGKGTGLGLATVFGIVKQSGGDITVESEVGKGATFTVILPSQPGPRRRGASGESIRTLPRGTETVLVVEDEDAVRRIVKIALESTGYKVIEARNGSEALEAARAHAGGIHIVVTDVVMPEMSGREVAERIVKASPAVKILYMSGYTDDAVMRHGIVEAGVAFLQKPFSPLALARKVREVLDGKPV